MPEPQSKKRTRGPIHEAVLLVCSSIVCAAGAMFLKALGVATWLAWPLSFALLPAGWWILRAERERYRCHSCHAKGVYNATSSAADSGDA